MRPLALALVLAASAAAQPVPAWSAALSGGIGIGDLGRSTAGFAYGGTLVTTGPALSVGVHVEGGEAIDFFRTPQRRRRTAALLIGRSQRRGPVAATVLVGPSVTHRVLHGARVGPEAFERVERTDVGAAGRLLVEALPLRVGAVRIGVAVGVGLDASAAGVGSSLVSGVAVRL